MENNILNEVKRNRELMGLNEEVIEEQGIIDAIKRGIDKGKKFIKNIFNKNNDMEDVKPLEQEPEELNSGSVEGVNYNIYKDDTIFYYDSINEHIARTKLEMILEELGIKNIVSYPYARSHDNIKVETTSGTVDGWRAQYTIPNKDLEEYFNTEE
jgi:hypothetical protein